MNRSDPTNQKLTQCYTLTCVFGEELAEVSCFDFDFQQVDLVEEENDGGAIENLIFTHFLEHLQRLQNNQQAKI